MKSTNSRIKKMMELFSVQGKSRMEDDMLTYISEQLDEIGGVTHFVKDRNIYATKGKSKIYPCVAAHTDTVHTKVELFEVMKTGDYLFAIDGKDMTRVGVGGDDRAGIQACLDILRTENKVKAVFFHSEEIGCVGSADADMTFFEDVSLVLQTDRKHNKEFINNIGGTKLQSAEFEEAVKGILASYEFKVTSGGSTDVAQLARNKIGISVANITSGYYRPHSFNEYQSISELFTTIEMMKEIIHEVGYVKRWVHVQPVVKKYVHPSYSGPGATYRRNSLPSTTPKNSGNHFNAQKDIPFTYSSDDLDYYNMGFGIEQYSKDDADRDTGVTSVRVTESAMNCVGACKHFEDSYGNEVVKFCMGCGEHIDKTTVNNRSNRKKRQDLQKALKDYKKKAGFIEGNKQK